MENIGKKFCFLARLESFSAAHRLHSPHLTDEENRKLYGKCNNYYGHGHNYKVEVTLKGHVDDKTGMVMNIADLKLVLQDVLNELDHRNIDQEVEYFKSVPSTAENIAIYIWEKLKEKSEEVSNLLHEVKLYETEKNIVIYQG